MWFAESLDDFRYGLSIKVNCPLQMLSGSPLRPWQEPALLAALLDPSCK